MSHWNQTSQQKLKKTVSDSHLLKTNVRTKALHLTHRTLDACVNSTGKVVPVHGMKAHTGSSGKLPLVLDLGTRCDGRSTDRITSEKRARTPQIRRMSGRKAGLDVSEHRKITCPCHDSNPGPPSP